MPIAKSNGAVATPPVATSTVAQTAPAPVSRKLDTTPVENKKTGNFEDTKSRRILVQGITQAVVQSPIVAGLGYTTETEIVNLVKSVSRQLIAFVDEESK